MSREDFPKKHYLERPPKRFPSFKASNNEPSFARFKHPTPIKKRQYSGCFFIKPPVKLYDDILSRNEILYSSLCKNLCYNYYEDNNGIHKKNVL